jgi:hypothetical protein
LRIVPPNAFALGKTLHDRFEHRVLLIEQGVRFFQEPHDLRRVMVAFCWWAASVGAMSWYSGCDTQMTHCRPGASYARHPCWAIRPTGMSTACTVLKSWRLPSGAPDTARSDVVLADGAAQSSTELWRRSNN